MRNVEDALRLVPGVRVQDESGTGILPNIGVRGLDPRRSQRTLVLVDGIPIALAPYGQTGLSLFPLTMQTVESIDVARGGVAVRYGPNNVGGVINFISKPIPETFSTTLKEADRSPRGWACSSRQTRYWAIPFGPIPTPRSRT